MEEPGYPAHAHRTRLCRHGRDGCPGRRRRAGYCRWCSHCRRSGTGRCDTRPTGAAWDDDVASAAACADRMGAAERRLDHRGRLSKRAAAKRTGGSGACIPRSWGTGAAHRQFSKTISPALRLGFLVVPPEMARRFGDVAACLAPAPAAPLQRAVAQFLREGHYLRHLRRMKRLYAARREALLRCLEEVAPDSMKVQATAGLAVVTLLPESASDVDIALRALPFGMAPAPLSPWYMQSPPRSGDCCSA